MVNRTVWLVLALGLSSAQAYQLKAMGFGQMLEPTPIGLRIISPGEHTNSLALRKNWVEELALYSPPSSISLGYLYDKKLEVQTEGESLQPSTSLWKQMGIYGLEFVGGSIGTVISCIAALPYIAQEPVFWDVKRACVVYTIGNALLTSTGTCAIGTLLGQKGPWWKAIVGATVGAAVGEFVFFSICASRWWFSEPILWMTVGITLIAPPLGATVGYNW